MVSLNLRDINLPYEKGMLEAVQRVLASGMYIRGAEVGLFEQEYARYIGCRCCVGVGNGLDALKLIYRAYMQMGVLSPGDEVILPANTYIASILAVTECGLVPVLVEPNRDTLQIDADRIEDAITERTRSVMIVHLYGRCAYSDKISHICEHYHLKLVEDNAQAHGCQYNGRHTGALGHAAAHSFYPTKNLGAIGDGGAVTTDDASLADMIRAIANYGSDEKYHFKYKGCNSRLDELQAAILRVKLPHLDSNNMHRSQIAHFYLDHLHNPLVNIPSPMDEKGNVWHQFPVFCNNRDALIEHLKVSGVETLIHYPVPPHFQPCYAEWGRPSFPITEEIHRTEVSLPISSVMSAEEAALVVDAVNAFKC